METQIRVADGTLRLREIEEAHRRLDAQEQERARRAREEQEAAARKETAAAERRAREVREIEEARLRARAEAEERKHKEAADAATRKRRAELIQKVLDDVVERYFSWEHEIPPSAKTAALQAVRKELSALPLEELPRAEVAAIAQGVRDGIYHPLFAAQDAERRRGEECREEEHRRAEIRRARIEAGTRHAENLLRDAEGLDFRDRLSASGKVKEALRREINGTESPADAERLAAELAAPFLADGKRKAEAERKEERRRAEEEHRAEADRTRREEEAEREERKRRLLRYADEYTGRALDEEEVPRGVDRWLLSETVKEGLRKRLSGDEAEEAVEDLVEEFLGKELRK